MKLSIRAFQSKLLATTGKYHHPITMFLNTLEHVKSLKTLTELVIVMAKLAHTNTSLEQC